MGLLNNYDYNEIEKKTYEIYVQLFTLFIGNILDPQEIQKLTKRLLDQAIEESKKEGSYNLPSNFGSILLEEDKADNPYIEKIAETIRKNLPKKRAEGVRDEDIKWWWNMNDIERRMMLIFDDINSTYYVSYYMENEGLTVQEAIKKLRKISPYYGDPLDTTYTQGDDRPLPYELKDRINIYIEKRDIDNYKKDTEKSSSFNALVRKEIKAGNI